MTQTLALLLDAYRELNARKMFWITLILSGVVMLALLIVGVTEDHELKVLVWDTPIPLSPETDLGSLLKSWFVYLGIGIWLTWAATILALISTASIYPDFLSGGSIDLVLSKPISRVRLFLTKYVGGLLFVTLQVAVFALAAFLIIGIRAGLWEFGLFLSVPLVVLFFSYLFSICAFWGVLTRSTIASLLATILIWIMLFALNSTDDVLLMGRVANEVYVEKLEERASSSDSGRQPVTAVQLESARNDYGTWRKWHGLVFAVKTALPKTSETVALLERSLIEAADLPDDPEQQADLPFITSEMWAAGVRPNEVVERLDQRKRERSTLWVIGTSLVFECIMLALACFIFVRRDY